MTSNIDHDYSYMKNSTPSSKISHTSNLYEKKQIFSSDAQIMDYVKSKGIQTRTGVVEEDFGIFILKELIDNVVDFIEEHVSTFLEKDEKPIIKITIELTDSNTKIRVINSNAEIDVFSEDLVRRIFNFNKFYSSKRNRYQISRGAFGDALKEVLCVPYAIADKKEIEDWNYGLEITTGNKKIDIKIDVDKIRQKINPVIKIKNANNNGLSKIYRSKHCNSRYI